MRVFVLFCVVLLLMPFATASEAPFGCWHCMWQATRTQALHTFRLLTRSGLLGEGGLGAGAQVVRQAFDLR